MSNIEDFVKNNREDFDKFEPGPVVWNNIQQAMKKPAEKKGILISINTLKWTAAAAVVLIIGSVVLFSLNNKKTDNPGQVAVTEPIKSNNLPKVTPPDTSHQILSVPENNNNTLPATKEQFASADSDTKEELAHYARLIEIKQQQIMKIKNDEPLLYQQFAGDFNKLDSTFHILKKQLPVNPNREQILEAMIQNLQYQEALLNQQLNIIKKINNTKKEAYEKAYRSA